MKKVKNICFVICLCVVMSVFFTGCNKGKQNKLYVATSSDYAPYEFVDLTKTGQDKYVGADIELAKYIAQKLNRELVIKSMAFTTILSDLDSKKSDLGISGFTSTPERRANYAFSLGYYDQGEGSQTLVIKTSDVEKYTNIASFNQASVKVAVQSGTYQAEIAQEQLPEANLVQVEDLANALTLLESGTYDAVVMASSPALAMIQGKNNLQLAPCQFEAEDSAFYVIATKNNTELIAQVDEIIAEVNSQGLYEKWVKDAEELLSHLGGNAGELIPDEE